MANEDTVLVMGVAGCGKSTIARVLAERLPAAFVEADSYHPPENIAAMSRGQPLDDAMRWGWLDAVAAARAEIDGPAVIACSALKRRYRDRLRAGLGPLTIVHLAGDKALLASRMASRPGHFMPSSLLESQFADLEPPGPDEGAVELNVAADPADLAEAALAFVRPRLQGGPARVPVQDKPTSTGGNG